ncbi:MAG TPA: Imm42 family immunity protein [Pirellulaceae bacterium]|jgi:hypothetical protein
MIVGNPTSFAIESSIFRAYDRPSFLALGFFVIHLCGVRYGVYEKDATLLACSFDEVKRRIGARGAHAAKYAAELSAGTIADAFRIAVFGAPQSIAIPEHVVESFNTSNEFVWAPDGDAAFDDGSYVLQYDVGDQVRLIAFRCKEDGLHDPATLSELWSESDAFYNILKSWLHEFHSEWSRLPKSSEA